MRMKFGALLLTVVGVVIGSLIAGDTVQAKGKGTHEHEKIHGKIIAMDSSSITIEIHHHHPGAAAAEGVKPNATTTKETKTFKLGNDAKVEIATKEAKTAGSASDVRVGEHVMITEHEGTVQTITVIHHHHKKTGAKS